MINGKTFFICLFNFVQVEYLNIGAKVDFDIYRL